MVMVLDTTEISRNVERLFEKFITINFRLSIYEKYFDKYFPMCQSNSILKSYAPNLALYKFWGEQSASCYVLLFHTNPDFISLVRLVSIVLMVTK